MSQRELTKKERDLVLILSHHPKIGARTIIKLRKLGILSQLVQDKNIKSLNINPILQESINESLDKFSISRINDDLLKNQISYICYGDKNYPLLLSQISDAPQIIFYKGEISAVNQPTVAIVGSRKASSYGLNIAYDFAYALAKSGVTIVSGLALGVDGRAHLGALEASGITIAVMGNGLDTIYPATHANLALKILANKSLIISEYPPGTPSYASNFPVRNRIIAGLSVAVLIVEAGKQSGSLLTAAAALEYGREVCAIPHNIDSVSGYGTNHLLQYGAHLVSSANDIISLLGLEQKSKNKNINLTSDNPTETLILEILSKEPIYIDDIIKLSKLTTQKVNSALTLMEIKGLIRHLGGNYYAKTF